ncbi:MAG TPA: zinc ribbon domain-containing protein [Dehalococcoidia bacterium]
MPIYEYFCPDCNFKFELLRPQIQTNENASCPRCHNNGAKRIFSSFASPRQTRSSEGASTPIGGGSSCSSCSATSCATCQM